MPKKKFDPNDYRKDFSAPDKPGPGRSVGIFLRDDQLKELAKLPRTRAYLVRQAVDRYLEDIKNIES